MTKSINLVEKLGTFEERWSPRTVSQFNGHDIMVVKVEGEFNWHTHDDTDDFFQVLSGELDIEMRDETVTLKSGEIYVVPKGVEHKPVAKSEAHLLLIEPTGTPNTDDALDAGLVLTKAGAHEGDILPTMQGAVFRGGGDYAGNEFIIGSGDAALMCRYASGRRSLDAQDQLTLEWSGAAARYQAAMMRTIVIGEAQKSQRSMHEACIEALEACEAAMKPGAPMGDVYAAHSAVFDKHGRGHQKLNACGYGMGAVYNPIWVDFPMFYENNPLPMQAGNVFFLHMILFDTDAQLAMCWGHSVLITDTGVERLSRSPLDLVVQL